MNGKKGNSLVVIENGQLTTYCLDDKLIWTVGRPSQDRIPDIRLRSTTVSRNHGHFHNTDGVWYYIDSNGKNGTVFNQKRVTLNKHRKVMPIELHDGDTMVFGGGDVEIINSKTVWAMFLERQFDEKWRTEDTKGLIRLSFSDGTQATVLENAKKGTVIEKENGIAIYMGDITYLIGDMTVTCK